MAMISKEEFKEAFSVGRYKVAINRNDGVLMVFQTYKDGDSEVSPNLSIISIDGKGDTVRRFEEMFKSFVEENDMDEISEENSKELVKMLTEDILE